MSVTPSPLVRKRTLWFVSLAIVGLSGTLIGLAIAQGWDRHFSAAGFEDLIRSWGAWGIAGSMGLMILHSFLPFPAELLAIANGMIYGPYWGIVITWTGAMLGAMLAFTLARTLGRPLIVRMISRPKLQALDNWGATNGWKPALISRFIPVIAFNIVNYAAGLTRLTWWQFIWTTGLGILPITVLMVVMGDSVHSLGWQSWLLLVAAILALGFVVHRKLKNGAADTQSTGGRRLP